MLQPGHELKEDLIKDVEQALKKNKQTNKKRKYLNLLSIYSFQ